MTDYKIVKAVHNGCEYDFGGGGGPYLDILVVGGGGYGSAGGGGAGAAIEFFKFPVECKSICAAVGNGGTAAYCNGCDSCFLDIVALGGGAGGQSGDGICNGCSGGNGGGAGYYYRSSYGDHAAGGYGQGCCTKYYRGNRGGGTHISYRCGQPASGGGGGAGGVGIEGITPGCCACNSAGGNGYNSILYGGYVAGGGDAQYRYDSTLPAACGNTECGAGGTAGAGKNGIIIVRYPTDGSYGITSATGGNCCCTKDGYQYHCFTSDGTFTIGGSSSSSGGGHTSGAAVQ